MHDVKKILAEKILSRKDEIESYFADKYQTTKPLFYSSVDIRYSGYKIVPVDTNLFPAGFNLLSQIQRERASQEVSNYLNAFHNGKTKVLIIPENHTRNKYYLLNVIRLSKILADAGLDVKIGNISITEKFEETIFDGEKIEIYPVERVENQIRVAGFVPEIIINNNDFSSGKPDILKGLKGQPIIPPVSLGWFKRRKSQHFDTYSVLSREFARKFDIDNWLISAYFKKCGQVNFKEKEGLNCVANTVDEILTRTFAKYKEYGIEGEPYAFVKANSGTYGMGIMVVKSAQEVLDINKKLRHSMNVIKEGVENHEVVVQEGIPTIDNYQGKPAEPMVYLVNSNPVGCTLRINSNQDVFGNLNSSGMEFVSFDAIESETENSCPVQSLIARLASLAAARECYEENWEI
jgi:glutamate--cysteine ligase